MKELMDATELQEYLGVSATTLNKLIRDKKIPKPYVLAPRIRRWRKSEVDEYINEQPKETEDDPGTDEQLSE